MQEKNESSNVHILVGAMAVIQTFFIAVLASLVVFKNAEWVLLGCILLFSLVNLAFTLVIGNIVIRLIESLKRQGASVSKIEVALKKMVRGPRSDGLVDIAE